MISTQIIVFRERETKRYDFEAQTTTEATEIVEETSKAMEPFHSHRQGLGVTLT